jgi:NAD(P)H-flavin reductase
MHSQSNSAYTAAHHTIHVLLRVNTTKTLHKQCILEMLSNPADKTQITLLYVNRSPSDILLKRELDALAAKHSNFKVVYKVDKADKSWKVRYTH